jgi:plastocyanin
MPGPRAAATAAAVALVLALGACGENRGEKAATLGSSTTGTAGEGGTPVAKIDVTLTEHRLAPARPTVPKPGLVEIDATNRGTIAHALEVEGPDGGTRTRTIAPGQTVDIKVDLDKPGRYPWYCPIDDHRRLGMQGVISVRG